MTDKHTNGNDTGRGVGERTLLWVGDMPVELPETLADQVDESTAPNA